MLLLMAFLHNSLPTFNPGDDVMKFNLRFEECMSSVNNNCPMFCAEGHGECEELLMLRATKKSDVPHYAKYQRHKVIDKLYVFILPAFTRWDAARFLSIALNPSIRHPKLNHEQFSSTPIFFTTIENTTCDSITEATNHMFDDSEQAHAFMPFLPMSVRFVANRILIRTVPLRFLPPTYEGTCVLSGLLLNIVAFSIASLLLHELTRTMLLKQQANKSDGYVLSDYIARQTAIIFCCNPANVFFTTAYSEATFAAWTFAGYLLDEQGKTFYAVLPWMMASYTRSNGSLVCVYLLLKGLGKAIGALSTPMGHTNSCASSKLYPFWHGMATMTLHIICACFVAIPLVYHDWTGYNIHCDVNNDIRPEWCIIQDSKTNKRPMFSLYGYVQRKHWNVGFLRYFSWKQLPNFMLATPILCIGVMATLSWIRLSWKRFISKSNKQHEEPQYNKPYATNQLMIFITWVIFALNECGVCRKSFEPGLEELLVGAGLLAHYAVFAGFCILGATVAHVQISTRLICSSCPAFYWYVVFVLQKAKKTQQERTHSPGYDICVSAAIKYYMLAFNIVGPFMYVTWLPWT